MNAPAAPATLARGLAWSTALNESVAALAVAPGGGAVAVATLGGEVAVLDLHRGQRRVGGVHWHDGGAFCVAWSPDGTRLASGGADGRVRLRGPDGFIPIQAEGGGWGFSPVPTAVGGWVQALAWSPDGTRLAVAAGRSLVLLGRYGQLVHRWDDAPSTVTGVAWSRDGSRVAAAAYGGLRWYAAISRSGSPVRTFDWKGSLLVTRVSPDGRWVATGNQDASVRIWRLWSGEDATLAGYPEKVDVLAFDRTSRWLACGGTDEISLWDFSGRGPMGRGPRMLPGHEAQVSALAWQQAGDLLGSGSRDGGVAIWAPGPKGRHTIPLLRSDAGSRVTAVQWSGDRLLFGTVDGRVGALGGRS